jgi:hypothetical protein
MSQKGNRAGTELGLKDQYFTCASVQTLPPIQERQGQTHAQNWYRTPALFQGTLGGEDLLVQMFKY